MDGFQFLNRGYDVHASFYNLNGFSITLPEEGYEVRHRVIRYATIQRHAFYYTGFVLDNGVCVYPTCVFRFNASFKDHRFGKNTFHIFEVIRDHSKELYLSDNDKFNQLSYLESVINTISIYKISNSDVIECIYGLDFEPQFYRIYNSDNDLIAEIGAPSIMEGGNA